MSKEPAPPYTRQQLAELAEVYLAHRPEVSESRLGDLAAGNDRLFFRLRAGADCLTATAERASAWFNQNWPADLAWPTRVPDRRRSVTFDREGAAAAF